MRIERSIVAKLCSAYLRLVGPSRWQHHFRKHQWAEKYNFIPVSRCDEALESSSPIRENLTPQVIAIYLRLLEVREYQVRYNRQQNLKDL
jgi:hypothetical protein